MAASTECPACNSPVARSWLLLADYDTPYVCPACFTLLRFAPSRRLAFVVAAGAAVVAGVAAEILHLGGVLRLGLVVLAAVQVMILFPNQIADGYNEPPTHGSR